jgi:hypothetical protein
MFHEETAGYILLDLKVNKQKKKELQIPEIK